MRRSEHRDETVGEATHRGQLSYLSSHFDKLSVKVDELVKLRNVVRKVVRATLRMTGHSTEFKNRKGTFTQTGLARLHSLFESGARTADIARFFDMSYTAIYQRRLRWKMSKRLERQD
jgi:hypothetical protein